MTRVHGRKQLACHLPVIVYYVILYYTMLYYIICGDTILYVSDECERDSPATLRPKEYVTATTRSTVHGRKLQIDFNESLQKWYPHDRPQAPALNLRPRMMPGFCCFGAWPLSNTPFSSSNKMVQLEKPSSLQLENNAILLKPCLTP